MFDFSGGTLTGDAADLRIGGSFPGGGRADGSVILGSASGLSTVTVGENGVGNLTVDSGDLGLGSGLHAGNGSDSSTSVGHVSVAGNVAGARGLDAGRYWSGSDPNGSSDGTIAPVGIPPGASMTSPTTPWP